MRTVATARGLAVFLGFAVVAFSGSVKWSPATHAQEERDLPPGTWRVEVLDDDARPKLGVWVEANSAGDLGGIRVTRVSPGGPAEEAGIREGDVIVSVGGHSLVQPLADEEGANRVRERAPLQRLRALLDDVGEGEAVAVEVGRDGESLTFDVVPERIGSTHSLVRLSMDTLNLRLHDMAEEFRDRFEDREWRVDLAPDTLRRISFVPGASRAYMPGDWLDLYPSRAAAQDLDLVELNPALGAYFGTVEGVLVADVADDSPLGLLPGDVVIAVEGREVDDAAELRRILRSYTEDEEIEFGIWRDGAETTVVGTINRP